MSQLMNKINIMSIIMIVRWFLLCLIIYIFVFVINDRYYFVSEVLVSQMGFSVGRIRPPASAAATSIKSTASGWSKSTTSSVTATEATST